MIGAVKRKIKIRQKGEYDYDSIKNEQCSEEK